MVGQYIKAKVLIDGYKGNENIEGPIIFENQHFMTVEEKNYRTSINKCDILTGRARIKVLL